MRRSGGSSTAFSRASAPSVAVLTTAIEPSACFSMPSTIGLSSTSRTLTLAAISTQFAGAGVVAALATGFALQDHFADLDSLIEGLAHVVNRQGGDAGGD